MKPAALARNKDPEVFEFIATCLEYDFKVRQSAEQLYVHPFLVPHSQDQSKFFELYSTEEHSEIVKDLTTKEAWMEYINKVCEPVYDTFFAFAHLPRRKLFTEDPNKVKGRHDREKDLEKLKEKNRK